MTVESGYYTPSQYFDVPPILSAVLAVSTDYFLLSIAGAGVFVA